MLLTGVFLKGYEPNAKVVSRLRCPWPCPTALGAGSLLGTSELVHGGSPPATNAVIGPQIRSAAGGASPVIRRRTPAEIRKRRTNHNAMNIARVHLDALKALGYTDAEARFLYLVATHSGYFVARQFLAFANAHWGGAHDDFLEQTSHQETCPHRNVPKERERVPPVFPTALPPDRPREPPQPPATRNRVHPATHWNPRFCSFQPTIQVLGDRAAKGQLFLRSAKSSAPLSALKDLSRTENVAAYAPLLRRQISDVSLR